MTTTRKFTNSDSKFPQNLQELAILLSERDSLTENEAQDIITDTLEEIRSCLETGNFHDIDDLIMDDLGLEPDYTILFLNELT